MIGLMSCDVFIAIEATASLQDASVGVCAQVKSVHGSYGPPKHNTKGKFRSQLQFCPRGHP